MRPQPILARIVSFRQCVFAILVVSWISACALSLKAGQSTEVGLTMPPEIHAVPGHSSSIYFDNVVSVVDRSNLSFDVQCDIGVAEKDKWIVTPSQADVGEHQLEVTVSDQNGRPIGQVSSKLVVVPESAGIGRHVNLLIIGDSLTHATHYPNELSRLLSAGENPTWRMLGTHHPASALPAVFHEGYGGWTWQRFATKYEPNPDGTHRKRSSPFVAIAADGLPRMNVAKYLWNQCYGLLPDYVIIMLGINDCFGADPKTSVSIDKAVDRMFVHAESVLDSIRQAVPDAVIGICLTTPPNARAQAFEINYKGRYPREGWKKIQHRIVQRQLAWVGNAKSEKRVSVIPTQLNLDTQGGYPDNNAVHPNDAGYRQIGLSIYAWLKAQLAVNEN